MTHLKTQFTDLVADFLYYDRKEDKDLPRGDIEKMILTGNLTVGEIVAKFREELVAGLSYPTQQKEKGI